MYGPVDGNSVFLNWSVKCFLFFLNPLFILNSDNRLSPVFVVYPACSYIEIAGHDRVWIVLVS